MHIFLCKGKLVIFLKKYLKYLRLFTLLRVFYETILREREIEEKIAFDFIRSDPEPVVFGGSDRESGCVLFLIQIRNSALLLFLYDV